MRIGIKAGPNVKDDYLSSMRNYADYIEIYAEIDTEWDYTYLSIFGIPVSVVHVAHYDSGVNFSDNSRNTCNLKALNNALKIADFFGCGKVVFHPEHINSDVDSISNLIQFLRHNHDSRLLVENMPFSTDGMGHLCRNPEEISEIITKANVGFCLDFTHACEYAMKMDIDSKDLLIKFMSLHPAHFHLADTDLSKVFDQNYNEAHLNLWRGDLDIEFIRGIIPDDADVTIETPQFIDRQICEISNLKLWKKK